jgi:cephalosporin hydroxylase
MQGMSISTPVLTAVRTAAGLAKKVLVLLDSDHSSVTVLVSLIAKAMQKSNGSVGHPENIGSVG